VLQTIRPFGSGTGSPGPASGEQKDSRYHVLTGGFYEQLSFIWYMYLSSTYININ